NWSIENWASTLSQAVKKYDREFLFIGTPDEYETTEAVRQLMGNAADATENICDKPDSLETTVGLLNLASGYIGRDTGPMHLAAALGKPVIALFGGGHWPCFTPAADPGVVL